MGTNYLQTMLFLFVSNSSHDYLQQVVVEGEKALAALFLLASECGR